MGIREVGKVSVGVTLAFAVSLLLLTLAPRAGAAPKLLTIDAPSKYVNPANQSFATDPLSPTMSPHPGTLKANVLLPDGYTKKKRYPLLLLLHGAGERFDSWADPALGNIAETAKGLNAIIVMPEAAHGFYTNWWNDGQANDPGWELYMREELLPLVKRRFSVRPERRYHAVVGFSMGGYGTYLTGSQLAGYFGTVVPLSAFASIRTPESLAAFSIASGGTPHEKIYGPADGYYAEGHDPIEWGPNLRHSNLDVYTGDGTPDTAVRPENGTAGDAISLVLEGVLKTQNDQAVAAIEAAGSKTVDYTVHPGSHDWEFWRIDLEAAIKKGLFRPAPERPANWSYRTSAWWGEAWDIDFKFSQPARTEMTEFKRQGRALSATGDGEVTIVDGNGCRFTTALPFTKQLPAKPCRRLTAKITGKAKAGKANLIKVQVTGPEGFEAKVGIDSATVKVGKKSVTTDGRGRASIKAKPGKKARKLLVTVKKAGYKPARKSLRVTGRRG